MDITLYALLNKKIIENPVSVEMVDKAVLDYFNDNQIIASDEEARNYLFGGDEA